MSRQNPKPAPSVGQTLTIEGQLIEAEFRRLPLNDVQLDLANPRIQYLLKQSTANGKLTQEDLAKLIHEDVPGVPSLFVAIRENKGLLEPILVRPDGRVIEGNCRLACYMRLHSIDAKRGISGGMWAEIPAYILPEISERQVAAFQGRVHVAGKNPWRAYEKAGHIYAMHKTHRMDAKVIGQILSMTESEVLREIRTYETMTQKLFPKMKGTEAVKKYSFFAEFNKRKELEQYREAPAHVDQFVSLVQTGKIKRGADVRKLAKILKNKVAMKALKTKGFESAIAILGQADPTQDSATFRQLAKTIKLLNHFPTKDLDRLKDPEPQRILRELISAARTVAQTAGVKVK
jgi:hypothetical protein